MVQESSAPQALATGKKLLNLLLASLDLLFKVLNVSFYGSNAEAMLGLPQAFNLIRTCLNKAPPPRSEHSQLFIDWIW